MRFDTTLISFLILIVAAVLIHCRRVRAGRARFHRMSQALKTRVREEIDVDESAVVLPEVS